jgi:hypothetical protein
MHYKVQPIGGQIVARWTHVARGDIWNEKSLLTLSLEKPVKKPKTFWKRSSCLFVGTFICNKNANFAIEQAMKAQWGSISTVLLFL